jgi:hypothetical protein
LGNVTSATVPGNNSVSTKTFTFGYTSDGTYSQSDAIGQRCHRPRVGIGHKGDDIWHGFAGDLAP